MTSTTLTTQSLTHGIWTSPSNLNKRIEVPAVNIQEVNNARTNGEDDSSEGNKKIDKQPGGEPQIDDPDLSKIPSAIAQAEDIAQEKRTGNINNSELKQENDKSFQSHPQDTDESFQILPKPQQDILLLHGPGQRYRLEKASDIPELKSDQEVLIQVR